MCNHKLIKINDVSVCERCGLTFIYDGKIIFDRKFPNAKKARKKRRKH